LAVAGTAGQQGRGEGEEIAGGRDEPAAAVFEARRPAPVPFRAVFDDELAGSVVALVGGRQPADVLAGHAEGGVLHPEWLADPLAQGGPGRQAPWAGGGGGR